MDPLTPQWIENRYLEYPYAKLGRNPTLADGPPSESRIDVLNTATPNLADEPTLANATDILWSRMAISHYYWHLRVQEWQFHIATDI